MFDKIYLSGNVSVLPFTFCFPLAPFTGSVISTLVAIWSPACFYYGLGIGIFVIGPINHCNRWELTNKNLASFLSCFLHLQLLDFLYNSLKTQTNVFFSFLCLPTHVRSLFYTLLEKQFKVQLRQILMFKDLLLFSRCRQKYLIILLCAPNKKVF